MPAPAGAPDSEAQQALVKQTADTDCFNWGYDPYHYSAPEGSYATDPADGARRIVEMRAMVMNLHRIGLRVGMDVVYNHTFTAGQNEKSVLDRIVPGYYHRLNAAGAHRTLHLLRQHRHRKPHDGQADDRFGGAVGEALQDRFVPLRPDGAPAARRDGTAAAARRRRRRTPRAADRRRLELRRSGRRRALRAGLAAVAERQRHRHLQRPRARRRARRLGQRLGRQDDQAAGLHQRPGVRPERAGAASARRPTCCRRPTWSRSAWPDRCAATSWSRTMAPRARCRTSTTTASRPATPASPAKRSTTSRTTTTRRCTTSTCSSCRSPPPSADRARVQILGAAINAFSQGVAYFHAGVDTLRSKSLDRNSFNSGDWFNRIDWSYQDNYFGTGAPPAEDNGDDYALIKPLLANRRAQAGAGRHRLRARRVPRPAGDPRQLDAVPPAHRRRHRAAPALPQHRPGAGADRDRRAPRRQGLSRRRVQGHLLFRQCGQGRAQHHDRCREGEALPAASGAPRRTRARRTATYDSATGTFSIPARTAVGRSSEIRMPAESWPASRDRRSTRALQVEVRDQQRRLSDSPSSGAPSEIPTDMISISSSCRMREIIDRKVVLSSL